MTVRQVRALWDALMKLRREEAEAIRNAREGISPSNVMEIPCKSIEQNREALKRFQRGIVSR